VYKRQFYQIVESNRIDLFFHESECSSLWTIERRQTVERQDVWATVLGDKILTSSTQ